MNTDRDCAICATRKHADEFRSMARYGCTCAEPLVCSTCTLRWFDNNNTGSNSFDQWSCPVCRGRTRRKTEFAEFIRQRFPNGGGSVASRTATPITTTFTTMITVMVVAFFITCIITAVLLYCDRHPPILSSVHQRPSHAAKWTSDATSKWLLNTNSSCVAGECTLFHIMPNMVINATAKLLPSIVDLSEKINQFNDLK